MRAGPHRWDGRFRNLGEDDCCLFAPGQGQIGAELGSWQGRLPQELRLHGITDLEEANQFLRQSYMGEFNRKFTVAAAQKGSAFVRIRRKDLDWIFSVQDERIVHNDNTIAVANRTFQLDQTRWRNTLAGPTVVVHEHLDGRMPIRYGPHVIARYVSDQLPPQAPRRRGTRDHLPAGHEQTRVKWRGRLARPACPETMICREPGEDSFIASLRYCNVIRIEIKPCSLARVRNAFADYCAECLPRNLSVYGLKAESKRARLCLYSRFGSLLRLDFQRRKNALFVGLPSSNQMMKDAC